MSHTTGPWEVRRDQLVGKIENVDGGPPQFVTITRVAVPIGLAQPNDAGKGTAENDLAMRRANARLIAAAPDLLEACEIVKRWAEADPYQAKQHFPVQMRIILAAIAKATSPEARTASPALRASGRASSPKSP